MKSFEIIRKFRRILIDTDQMKVFFNKLSMLACFSLYLIDGSDAQHEHHDPHEHHDSGYSSHAGHAHQYYQQHHPEYHHDDMHDHHHPDHDDHDLHGHPDDHLHGHPDDHLHGHPDDHLHDHDLHHDVIIFSMAINWSHLWHEGASLEEVHQDHRDHVIGDVLHEIGEQMDHLNDKHELTVFEIRKVQENLALVEYPHLSGLSEIELNIIANELLFLGDTILNVNVFVNNHAIQIVDLGMHGHGPNYHEEDHFHHPHHDHEGIWEGEPHGDRALQHHDWEDQHQLWHQDTGTVEEQIHEVQEAIHKFDQEMHDIHEESEHYVEAYHKDYKDIEDEYHHRLEDLEREFVERFTDLEHHYNEDLEHMQDQYDEAHYHKTEAEAEWTHLHEMIN